MKINLSSNLGLAAGSIEKLAANTPALVKTGVSRATQSLYYACLRFLKQLIYGREIPKVTRKRGKDKGKTVLAWRRNMRNGGILGAEKFAIASDGFSGDIFTDPTEAPAKPIKNWPGGYAQRQHERDSPEAKWRVKGEEEGSPRALALFQEAVEGGIEDAWRV